MVGKLNDSYEIKGIQFDNWNNKGYKKTTVHKSDMIFIDLIFFKIGVQKRVWQVNVHCQNSDSYT